VGEMWFFVVFGGFLAVFVGFWCILTDFVWFFRDFEVFGVGIIRFLVVLVCVVGV